MKFAHFSHVWGKPDMTPHDRYEQLWRELELCDELRFDYAFCVEHHFVPHESWMSAPSLFAVAAGARTKHMRVGPMGYVVPLYNPLRLAEEIAIIDQMLGGRLEVGLVPGINAAYFEPFGLDYNYRKSPTLEYLDYLRAAYGEEQPFTFIGDNHKTTSATLSVQPVQKPYPPMWMQSRDPETLEFCAANGMHTGYFLVFPRDEAAPRYRKYLADWDKAGWDYRPNIAYSTVIYVDESDDKALDTALFGASRAYEGFLPPPGDGKSFDERVAIFSQRFLDRGEDGAAQIFLNLFDPDYLLENDLVFIGSPETVTRKLHDAAATGLFNTFMGEFNFSDLAEDDLMRSIRLFGEKVMPALRDFEPF
ncbi:MAG: LLM class flavin-dependent oxidoreductase [Rhodospirillales bacterium]|jgi:alkanesulfonate monooxygenase SsuD/methylene tetrahydromethanopterin reductase-like flavin-dependent oxidoreductase (luciferase family)